jgi:parallel beta-helix repeat protein
LSLYTRARASWSDWPLTTTLVRASDLEKWDKAVFDLKTEKINALNYLNGDGSTESAASVASLVADAAGRMVLFPPATYVMPNTTFGNATMVVGCGPGTVIKSSGDTHCFNFANTTDCAVEGIWFASITSSEALNGNGSTRLRIRHCDFNSCLMGPQFGGTALDPVVTHTTVRFSTTTNAAQGAVYLANVQRGKFFAVDVTDSAGNGYFLGDAPDTSIVLGEVSRNGGTTAGRRGINFGTSGTAPRAKIGWLHMLSNAEQAIYCSTNSPDGKIANCIMTSHNNSNTTDSGTIELGSSGWSVESVDVEESLGNSGNPQAVFIGGSDTSLIGLRVRNSNGRGISVWGANDARIEGNLVKNSGRTVNNSGIYIANSSQRPLVLGNRCYDDQGVPTQNYGLETVLGVDRMLFDANILTGNKLGPTLLADTNRTTGANVTA